MLPLWLGQYAHQKGKFAQGRHLIPTTIFMSLHRLDSDAKHFTFDMCKIEHVLVKSI